MVSMNDDNDYHEAEAEGFDIGPVERVEHHLGVLQSVAGLVVGLALIVAAVAFFAVDRVSLGVVAVLAAVFAVWVAWQAGRVIAAAEEATAEAEAYEAADAEPEADARSDRDRAFMDAVREDLAERAAEAGLDLDNDR